MGGCFSGHQHHGQKLSNAPQKVQKAQVKPSQVKQVDMVKAKLKVVRDKIQAVVNRTQIERNELNQQIRTRYEKNKNKKQLLPLLNTKKQLEAFVNISETRLQVIHKTLRDVEVQQMDSNMMSVLEESNKYMAKVQQELEDKDWRSIVEQAKQKYEGVQWEAGEEEDEQFKALWHELGGDKLDEKEKQKTRPSITIPISNNSTTVPRVKEVIRNDDQQRQVHYA